MEQSNRLELHNLPSSSRIDWKKYEPKSYLHFDTRKNIEHVKDQIQNSNWVEKHAFLPFIHFEITFNKYVLKNPAKVIEPVLPKDRKEKREKKRQIHFASHLDSYIYKYYGNILNNFYNEYAVEKGIDEISLAYRNNKKGLNNIDFSKEVFEYILKQEKAIIIALDFTSFFDKINHEKLKENLKIVLGCNELSKDFYKVYKSLTNFSYVHKTDVDEYLENKHGKEQLKELIKERKISRIMSPHEFRDFKRKNLFKHKKNYGIPQGSGMSAVCSNVHLIQFDQEIKKWAEDKNALYRRYCDDLILVIPSVEDVSRNADSLTKELFNIVKSFKEDGLIIQEEKTEVKIYEDKLIKDVNGNKDKLDYLGFILDGETVKIREKSLFKFYSRAYRKAKVCRNITYVTGEKYERGKLYSIYTHLGFKYKGHGNFISYAKKAHEKMSSLPVKSLIRNQTKRHWRKIHKRLKS